MEFPPLLMLGLYCSVLVARASFVLPRSHRGEVRLTVGRTGSSLDSQANNLGCGYCQSHCWHAWRLSSIC